MATAHTLHYDPRYYPDPSRFRPERFLSNHEPSDQHGNTEDGSKHGTPQSYFRTFGRGPRACLGRDLALDELRVILLMTVRDYDFECANLNPNLSGRSNHTQLDTIFGDAIFQELGTEARVRGKVEMRVRKRS